MPRIEIGIWQFVRIMVQFEDEAERKNRPPRSVYERWCDAWKEVDSRLTALGRSDPAAYSDLMMNQEIVLEWGAAQMSEVSGAIDSVVRAMKKSVKKGGENRRLDDLRFEIQELDDLRRRIAPAGRKVSRKPRYRAGSGRKKNPPRTS